MPIANSADDKAMYGCFAIVEIMKKTPASLFVCLLLVILASDCKHSTEPPVPPGPDTTSHAITWQIDRLGGASSSVLADVVIVNDTLAYAVGEMYIRDSTGAVDPIPYNLAEWNGARWTLKRLMFPIFNEHGAILGYGPDPGRSIFVVSPGDFWVASASALIHWTAEAKVPEPVTLNYQQGRINTIFGASGDLYLGCENGWLIYWSREGLWRKLETGTTLDIEDIYGAQNPATGAWEILAACGNLHAGLDHKILKIDGASVTALSDSGTSYTLHTVWFTPGGTHYLAGDWVYEKATLASEPWVKILSDLPWNYTRKIRGTAANDVFLIGDFGDIFHYNGKSWQSYLSQTALPNNGGFDGISLHGDLIFAVGEDPPYAAIARGKRMR